MKTLQISENTARRLYQTESTEFKAMLDDTFGKDFFKQSIMDRVKTYEGACAELGEEPLNEENLRNLGFSKDEIVYRKLKTIVRALNEGWVAKVYDEDEYRYYPWFEHNGSSSGFAFRDSYYDVSATFAGSGSRLCFKTRELSNYAGKQFLDLWREFIV